MANIKTKYFPILLLSASIIVESCAAFFSVYGLTKLFSGALIAVGIMAGSLEFAKVISASYLYRYWSEIGKLFRVYFTSAIVILMLITSLGIYGFLSNAFQGSTVGLEKDIAKLSLQETEISRIKDDNTFLKNEKDGLLKERTQSLNALQSNDTAKTFLVASRRNTTSKQYQSLIKEKDVLITENNKKIEQLSQTISDSKVKMIDSGADVGPIIFVSKAFGIDISTTVQYLILLFIVVFDPLALALIIAFNKITIENAEETPASVRKEFGIKNLDEPIKYIVNMTEEVSTPIRQTVNLEEDKPEMPIEEFVEQIKQTPEPPKEEPKPEPTPVMKNLMQKYGNEEEEGITYVDTAKDAHPNWPKPVQTSSF